MLGKEYDSIASWAKLADILVVVLDIFCFGAGNEKFFFYFDSLFLHLGAIELFGIVCMVHY